MSRVVDLTVGNFEQEVLDSGLPVLVDYWAPWCGPCRIIHPVIEDIAAERAGQLKVARVNVDDEHQLAESAEVRSIPYLVLYEGGAAVASVAGAFKKQVIERILGLDALLEAA